MSDFRRAAQSRRLQLADQGVPLLDWPAGAEAIILLHPNRTNARVWDFVVDASALPNRCLAPDARGHGSRMPFSSRWSEAMKDHTSSHSFVEEADGRFAWRSHSPGAVSTEHPLETPIWDRVRVSCPTLAVRGSASDVFARANMERLAALIDDFVGSA